MKDDVASGDYVVPIYVDSLALIDVLASIEGGFSSVERFVSKIETEADRVGEFGLGGVLSLLRLNLKAKSSTKTDSTEETSSDRFHSSGSLLNRLRRHLRESELLRRCPPWTIHPSEFVEFRGIFRPNPVTDTLVKIRKIMDLMSYWPQSKTDKAGALTMKQMGGIIDGLLRDLHDGDRRVFVVEPGEGAPRVVCPINTNFLRDRSFSEISHGEFRITGKVVRKLDSPSGETISLLPGGAVTAVGPVFYQIVEAIKGLGSAGMKLPDKFETEIPGPALVVLPIGISI